jgi:dihydrofolate reductase
MAKLLYSAAMSLDGFIAGYGGDMSWLAEHFTGEDPTASELLAGTGALLVGRNTFGGDDPNRGTDKEGAFGGQYQGPVVVLTHRAPADPPADITFCSDLHSAVDRAKEAAGDKYVTILGANVAKQCLEAGLLDEVLVLVAPVLLGDGVPLFRSPGGTNVRLTPISDRTPHWYRVVYDR